MEIRMLTTSISICRTLMPMTVPTLYRMLCWLGMRESMIQAEAEFLVRVGIAEI